MDDNAEMHEGPGLPRYEERSFARKDGEHPSESPFAAMFFYGVLTICILISVYLRVFAPPPPPQHPHHTKGQMGPI